MAGVSGSRRGNAMTRIPRSRSREGGCDATRRASPLAVGLVRVTSGRAEPTSHRPCQIRARYSDDPRGTAGSHGDTARHSLLQPLACHRSSGAVSAGVAGQGFEPWRASADGFTGRLCRRFTSIRHGDPPPRLFSAPWRRVVGHRMPSMSGGSACDDTSIITSPCVEEGPRSRTRGGGSLMSRFISHADT
jgi:hypothetical protein